MVAVLGGTGGGRDRDRRQVMGSLASTYAQYVIVTDEDPYDESPRQIMDDVAQGQNSEIIESRREAINKAIVMAMYYINNGNVVYIMLTGKGTDPYIMRANGEREIWDDATVVREEIERINKDLN